MLHGACVVTIANLNGLGSRQFALGPLGSLIGLFGPLYYIYFHSNHVPKLHCLTSRTLSLGTSIALLAEVAVVPWESFGPLF